MFHRLRVTRPLAFLDVESTGANPQADRVVEVAVFRVDPDGKTVSAVRRVNPTVPIPAAATKVHGIADADVAGCRPFADVARRLVRFLDGCDLAGFGIKRFDLPILAAECRRAGVHFPLTGRAVVDALQIYHQHERRDLASAVAFYTGGAHAGAHTAAADAEAAARVLDAQLRKYRDLPPTVGELHKLLTGADLGGWFRDDDGRLVFARGKHAGRPLADVAARCPDYVRWLLSLDLLDDTRALVEQAQQAHSGD